MARDLYSVLGVARDADEDTIKKAFRKLAMKYHPDKSPGKANETKFKEINSAHEVLSDKEKRALYDEFGEESLSQNFDAERARMVRRYGGGGMGGGARRGPTPQGGAVDINEIFGGQGGAPGDFGDLLGDIFGRTRGAPGRVRASRGADLETSVTIDFVGAVKGTTLSLQPRGSETEATTVRVPPGAAEGSRLRIVGQGAPGTGGGPSGDLIIEIHVTPHAFFRREGDDLHLDVPISPGEAYHGGKVRIPTPDGDVTLKVPKHAQSGQVTRLRGKGVTRKGKEPGDLYVKFLVRLPAIEDPDVEKAVETLDSRLTDLRGDLRF